MAIVVNKSELENVVMKIVCNGKVIALKLKAKLVSVLFEQVYMVASEYEDDEVEELHGVTRNFEDEVDRKGDKHHYTGRVQDCGWRLTTSKRFWTTSTWKEISEIYRVIEKMDGI